MYKKIDFKKFLAAVEKPSRYINHEINSYKVYPKKETINFCLAFPDVYEIGISHLGLKILYSILNSENDCIADRVYTPWPDFGKILQENNLPLFGVESQVALKEFDFLGFTLQSELTFTNILYLLELAQIPLFAKDRPYDFPIIIAGGPAGNNPLPLIKFIDIFVIGDAEDAIIDIKNSYKKNKNRTSFLKDVSKIQGVYVPSIEQEEVHIRKNMDFDNLLKKHTNQLITWQQATHDRYVAEIMRGCTRGCRFCHAGYFYRPTREIDPKIISDLILEQVEKYGWREIALTSLSSSDYSQIKPLLLYLHENLNSSKTKLSLPSLRVDSLDDELISLLNKFGRKNMTIAPEAGSQRLRDIINKNISEKEILDGVKIAADNNWKTIKLYFMIGLPFELEDDIDEIIKLVEKIIRITKKKIKINITISPFVPKPFTPFQWAEMLSKEKILARASRIKRTLRKHRFVKISYHEPDSSILEGIISRGDSKIGDLIFEAYKNGAKFDGWNEFFDIEYWHKAQETIGIEPSYYLGERDIDQQLPWEFIKIGINKKFLISEWKKAKDIVKTEDCRDGKCSDCGVCDFSEIKNIFSKNEITVSNKKSKKIVQSEFFHYRVTYEKSDWLQYISHLDLLRMIHRVLSSAKIPLAFSQGYNPHPKVAFGPPLPIGVQGLNEFFDVSLYQEMDSAKLLKTIKESFKDILPIKNISRLHTKKERNMNLFQFEEFLIQFNSFDSTSIKEKLLDFQNAESWAFERIRKSKRQKVNLKSVIMDIQLHKDKLFISKKFVGANLFNILESIFGIIRTESGELEIIRLGLKKELTK
ncbi:MAG: TIGR03960 family B12-binding radical SAM protein [Candidatus Cloacimonadota bacterium]|nr:TIGR03960 family B12-binding radical SAM protein [Candidatus Cloacimonadota bacterium]